MVMQPGFQQYEVYESSEFNINIQKIKVEPAQKRDCKNKNEKEEEQIFKANYKKLRSPRKKQRTESKIGIHMEEFSQTSIVQEAGLEEERKEIPKEENLGFD